MPVITHERKEMNAHNERPGKGVMFYEMTKEHERGPDYKGFIILEMDYKAGEKLTLSEDNFTKKRRAEYQPDKEVTPAYVKHKRYDDDVPF